MQLNLLKFKSTKTKLGFFFSSQLDRIMKRISLLSMKIDPNEEKRKLGMKIEEFGLVCVWLLVLREERK